VISALGSINGVAYGSASESAKDAWLVDNADRVLFGAAVGNNSANDHSASLANEEYETADPFFYLSRPAFDCINSGLDCQKETGDQTGN